MYHIHMIKTFYISVQNNFFSYNNYSVYINIVLIWLKICKQCNGLCYHTIITSQIFVRPQAYLVLFRFEIIIHHIRLIFYSLVVH